MAKSEVSRFVESVLARLTGDQDKALALKNEKLAISALKTQIALKEGELVEAESNVEAAQENLKEVTFPTTPISRDNYVRNLINAQEKLKDAEEDLEVLNETLSFLKETLASF